jgi:hypothetical protein
MRTEHRGIRAATRVGDSVSAMWNFGPRPESRLDAKHAGSILVSGDWRAERTEIASTRLIGMHRRPFRTTMFNDSPNPNEHSMHLPNECPSRMGPVGQSRQSRGLHRRTGGCASPKRMHEPVRGLRRLRNSRCRRGSRGHDPGPGEERLRPRRPGHWRSSASTSPNFVRSRGRVVRRPLDRRARVPHSGHHRAASFGDQMHHRRVHAVIDPGDGQTLQAQQPGRIINRARGSSLVTRLASLIR